MATEVGAVKADSQAVCEAVGFETEDVRVSLAAEDRPEAGWEGDGVEKVLEKLGGALGFSISHVGPSLEGTCEEEFVLVLVTCGEGVNLETGVFVGKSLKGTAVLVGDSDLKDGKQKVSILLTLTFLKEGQSSTADQSESRTTAL